MTSEKPRREKCIILLLQSHSFLIFVMNIITKILERLKIVVDIGSGRGYPSSALSNFAPHPFVIDGIQCASMEGFLQSLKFESPEMQEFVCSLVGKKAKFKGKGKRWQRTQTLWWRGEPIKRDSEEYQNLLDRAFDALNENEGFRAALGATGNAVLTHSIGKKNEKETVLTAKEFTSRLTKLREKNRKK